MAWRLDRGRSGCYESGTEGTALTIGQIDREHPEFQVNRRLWKQYQDLYAGGERLRTNAAEYLMQRSKEPADVYGERLGRVFYENYIGSIIDWYSATLMRREPAVMFEGHDERARQFFGAFITDCDMKGSTLSEFFRRQLTQVMVCGRSFIVVDFPRGEGVATTRAEEDASGRSRAFLTEYSPEEAINWSHDQSGLLEWIVLRTSTLRQNSVTDSGWRRVTRWIYYDREHFQIFERDAKPIGGGVPALELVAEGRHGFAAQKRVPVFELKVSEGLWLMNKAALLQLEHFNKSNALAWALTMGLFATPVIYSDKEWNQIVGESYYIQLGKEDRFGWTEPTGSVFQIASDNLVRLKDEIYRVSYLVNQTSGRLESGAGQSGLSKRFDFSVTQDILRAYGDVIKEMMLRVLTSISIARQDALTIDVSGLNEFDIEDFGVELANAKQLLELGIASPTLKRQLFKKIALKYFCDSRQEIKNMIADEIDASLRE